MAFFEEYCHNRCGFLGCKLEQGSAVELSSEPVEFPNHQNAVASEHKLAGYLLSSLHAYGRHKAAFFTRFGFSADAWETLARALLEHASQNEVVRIEDSPFGNSYIINGQLLTPDTRNPRVCAIWFIQTGEEVPDLVTAYPLEQTGGA